MPTLVEKPPEGHGWVHEVKFDGNRSQIVRDADGVRIFTRRGLDWTSKYRDLAKAAGEVDVEGCDRPVENPKTVPWHGRRCSTNCANGRRT